ITRPCGQRRRHLTGRPIHGGLLRYPKNVVLLDLLRWRHTPQEVPKAFGQSLRTTRRSESPPAHAGLEALRPHGFDERLNGTALQFHGRHTWHLTFSCQDDDMRLSGLDGELSEGFHGGQVMTAGNQEERAAPDERRHGLVHL